MSRALLCFLYGSPPLSRCHYSQWLAPQRLGQRYFNHGKTRLKAFTSDGVVVGVAIRSVEWYDLEKIKSTESEAEPRTPIPLMTPSLTIQRKLHCPSRKQKRKNKPNREFDSKPGDWLVFPFCFLLRQSRFHWIIKDGLTNGIGRNGLKRSDSSYSDSVELLTPLTTFHKVASSNTGQLAYVQTRLRTNSPTTCQLAYVGEFASWLRRVHSSNVCLCFYNFMLSFCEQCPNYFSFGSAVDERTRNNWYACNLQHILHNYEEQRIRLRRRVHQ